MKMTGEQRIAAPRARVWEALNDVEILKQSIPGCQSLEREADDRLRALVEVKIGPIGARFNGLVTLSNIDAPNGYTISGEGQGGTVGFAKGGAKVRLADDNGGTLLSYDVDAQVGGRLAQLGGPIIDTTAKRLADQFFKRFGENVATPAAAGPSAVAPASLESAPSGAVAPAPQPVYAPAAQQSSLPMAWILALVVAALTGFLVGRSQGDGGSDWMGLAIGLLLVIVAAAAFEYGRRAASPVVTIDPQLLARLRDGAKS